MKHIILIIVFFGMFFQNKKTVTLTKISFVKTIRMDSVNTTWQGEYHLIRGENFSKFFKKSLIKNKIDIESGDLDFKPKKSKSGLIYKNYVTNTLYSEDLIGFKLINIKDSINIFKWKIKNKTQIILGYNCNLAETFFRGRAYKAWFTTELIAGGPWKFDGLPGMILKVESLDNYVSFEAVNLNISQLDDDKINKENIYLLENKFLGWSEFKQKYKSKAIKMSSFNPEDDVYFVAPRIRMERYIDEDDKDYIFNNK